VGAGVAVGVARGVGIGETTATGADMGVKLVLSSAERVAAGEVVQLARASRGGGAATGDELKPLSNKTEPKKPRPRMERLDIFKFLTLKTTFIGHEPLFILRLSAQ